MKKAVYLGIVFLFLCTFRTQAQSTVGEQPARLWTKQDRSELIQMLISNRDSLVGFISGLTEKQFHFYENEKRWSIAAIFEHLERYELVYLKEVTILAGMPFPEQSYLAITQRNDRFFQRIRIRYGADRHS